MSADLKVPDVCHVDKTFQQFHTGKATRGAAGSAVNYLVKLSCKDRISKTNEIKT